MQCKFCGKELPDESKFCPYCMGKFVDENQIAVTPKQKKSPKMIIIAVIAVVCVVAIVVTSVLVVPKVVKKLAEEYGLFFLPLQDKLTAAENAGVTDLLGDGVHPAKNGVKLIGEEWLKAFNAIKA